VIHQRGFFIGFMSHFRDPEDIQLEFWAFDPGLVRPGFNATPMSKAP
jgi:hypothetical protein